MFWIVLQLALAATGSGSSDLGALEISTLPGAEVHWEGISLGATDEKGVLLIEQIPSGRYRVGLRKEGFQDRAVDVEIEAGRITRLTLALPKLSPPKPAPKPRREPPVRRPEPPPARVEERSPEPPRENVAQPPADEPAIEQSPRVSEAAELTEPASEPQREGLPVGLSLLVAMALVGGLGLFLARRRSQPVPLRYAGPRPVPPDPEAIAQTEDDPGFIETLRQQEQDLHDSEPGSWKREPEIIDAEFIEVLETNEE